MPFYYNNFRSSTTGNTTDNPVYAMETQNGTSTCTESEFACPLYEKLADLGMLALLLLAVESLLWTRILKGNPSFQRPCILYY